MARTRGASQAFHQDDGELIDKDGKPLPTGLDLSVQHDAVPKLIHMDDGELVPVAPKAPLIPVSVNAVTSWHCDLSTIRRDIEAFDVMHIVSLAFGGLSLDLIPEEFAKLPPDVRRHFRRVI